MSNGIGRTAYVFLVLIVFISSTALAQQKTVQKVPFEAPCVSGTQWHSFKKFAALSYCEEEPPHVIALMCEPNKKSLAVELDFSPPDGKEIEGPIIVRFHVGDWSKEYSAQPNYLGLYERLTFSVDVGDPLITSLRKGQTGRIEFLGKTTPIHLTGASRAIGLMLENCGL